MTWTDTSEQPGAYEVQLVDHAHPSWPVLLKAITAAGQRHVLRVAEGGWLSARQSVAAATRDGQIVGFTMFHVELFRSREGSMRLHPNGLTRQAIIDVTTTAAEHHAAAKSLIDFAKEHARNTLSCVEFDQQWLAA